MQFRRRESVEMLTETVISALLTLFRIIGTLLQIVWILVMAIYRTVEGLDAVANRGKFNSESSAFSEQFACAVNVVREAIQTGGKVICSCNSTG